MNRREKVLNMLDVAINELGVNELLEALTRALTNDELEENLLYIARMYDLNIEEEEEEEEEF